MKTIIKLLLIVSILGLFTACGGPSKQELLAIKKARLERIKKLKEKQRLAKIEAQKREKQRKLAEEKRLAEEKERLSSTVETIGYGNTKDEALKNAFSSAVSQYVGVLVDAKEVVKNGKLIQDKILTFSNGYIDTYETISSKKQMGLWEVSIKAIVKKQDVLNEIKKLKIKAKDIKGSEDRYARLISQIKSKFEAEDMIVALIKEYASPNYSKYMDLKIDSIYINEELATRKFVPITVKYSMHFNWDNYNIIVNKFRKLFNKVGAIKVKKYLLGRDRIAGYLTNPIKPLEPVVADRSLPYIVIIDKNKNKDFEVEVWKFPNSYKVVYPFNAEFLRFRNIDGEEEMIYSDKWISIALNAKIKFKDALNKDLYMIDRTIFNYYIEYYRIFNTVHINRLSASEQLTWGEGDRSLFAISPPEAFFGQGYHLDYSVEESKTINFKVSDIKKLKKVILDYKR